MKTKIAVSTLWTKCATIKVRVKLRNLADMDFDLDPNWGIKPNIETLYKLPCLPDTLKPKKYLGQCPKK